MTERLTHSLGWHLEDLEDFELRLVVLAEPIVLKNSRQIIHGKADADGTPGRAFSIPSSAATAFLKSAAQQIRDQWYAVFREPMPLDVFLNAAIHSYLGTRRHTDASGLYEAPQDAMKSCGPRCKPKCKIHAAAITDDWQIATHDGSRRHYDHDRPRVEIVLTPAHDSPASEWASACKAKRPVTGILPGLDPAPQPEHLEF